MEQIKMLPQMEKPKTGRLYPERAFLRIDSEIERLKKIESGEIKKLELTEEERFEVLAYEEDLGKKFEDIYDIKVNSALFYTEYFLTEEGKTEFRNVTSFDVEGSDVEEINLFLLKNRKQLDSIDGKKLAGLVGKSKTFNDEKMLGFLKKKMGLDGELDVEGISNPQRTYIILNPAEAFQKIQRLRKFKKELLLENDTDKEKEIKGQENIESAKKKIRGIYRKRVNTMIAGEAGFGAWAFRISELLGEDELSEEEKNLKKMFPGIRSFEKMYARYDRFVYGAALEYDEKGERLQVGEELDKYLAIIEEKYIAGKLEKEKGIEDKGLDSEKLKKRNIDCSTFSALAEDLLDYYGEKSVYPASEYDKKRKGPAEDGKWQFVAREEDTSMSRSSKQRVIKSGIENKSITETLGTLLGHEFAHFVQTLNISKMPLKILSKIGGDRSGVFSEGGAMMVEDMITREFFGYETNPHPHYIRAMKKRLEGGTYLECVKAFYDSEFRIIKKKKELGLINENQFVDEVQYWLKISLNRVKRLFSANENFSSKKPYLTESSDTLYAEQAIAMEKIKENGLERYAFIEGINLSTLAIIAEIGLLDPKDINKPDIDPIRKIWEKERSKYLLDDKIADSKK